MGISSTARRSLIERQVEKPPNQRRICPMCGRQATGWEIDHKHPKSRGGTSLAENLWVICEDCNRLKANRTLYELAKAGAGEKLSDSQKEGQDESKEKE